MIFAYGYIFFIFAAVGSGPRVVLAIIKMTLVVMIAQRCFTATTTLSMVSKIRRLVSIAGAQENPESLDLGAERSSKDAKQEDEGQ